MNFGPEHGLVDISAGMTLEFTHFGIKRPLSNLSSRKQTGISMYLYIGVNLLASTKEIQIVLSYQCSAGEPV